MPDIHLTTETAMGIISDYIKAAENGGLDQRIIRLLASRPRSGMQLGILVNRMRNHERKSVLEAIERLEASGKISGTVNIRGTLILFASEGVSVAASVELTHDAIKARILSILSGLPHGLSLGVITNRIRSATRNEIQAALDALVASGALAYEQRTHPFNGSLTVVYSIPQNERK